MKPNNKFRLLHNQRVNIVTDNSPYKGLNMHHIEHENEELLIQLNVLEEKRSNDSGSLCMSLSKQCIEIRQ